MLFALGQPIALIGLLTGFLLAVLLRAVVQHALAGRGRMAMRRGRCSIRVATSTRSASSRRCFGGTGWGRRAPESVDGRPKLAVLLAAPGVVLLASQAAFLAARITTDGPFALSLYVVSDILHGIPGSAATQFLTSLAVSLLCFGLLALVPLPPLDGWGLLARRAGPRPGPNFAKAQLWLDEKNIGVVILLVGLVIPLTGGLPIFVFLLNVIGTPVMRAWA